MLYDYKFIHCTVLSLVFSLLINLHRVILQEPVPLIIETSRKSILSEFLPHRRILNSIHCAQTAENKRIKGHFN